MSPFLAEFIGTALLVTFGNGVVANVVLSRTKGEKSGWLVITTGWALAVFIGVFCSQASSGAHLNPALTIAAAAAGTLPWARVGGKLSARLLRPLPGGCLGFFFSSPNFKVPEDPAPKLASFA